jgi:hypothetical protein
VLGALARNLPVSVLYEAMAEVIPSARENDAGLVARFLQRKLAERQAAA